MLQSTKEIILAGVQLNESILQQSMKDNELCDRILDLFSYFDPTQDAGDGAEKNDQNKNDASEVL